MPRLSPAFFINTLLNKTYSHRPDSRFCLYDLVAHADLLIERSHLLCLHLSGQPVKIGICRHTLSFSDRHSSSVKRMTTALFLLLIDLYTSCFHKNSARPGRIRGLRVLPEMCFLISKSVACFLGLHPWIIFNTSILKIGASTLSMMNCIKT